jgi:hypothetical protein
MDTRKIIMAFLSASSIALGIRPRKKWTQEEVQKRIQTHQERLHQRLKLSAEQEAAWTRFAQKASPKPDLLQRPDPEIFRTLTTPERTEKLLCLSKAHQTFLSTRLKALKIFYALLTSEQQKTFDKVHAGFYGKGDKKRHDAPKGKRESKKN